MSDPLAIALLEQILDLPDEARRELFDALIETEAEDQGVYSPDQA
jgi:hypothetical protein